MLVLSRVDGQSVIITHGGEVLKFTVFLKPRKQIKMAFDGPREFRILREEIAQAKDESHQVG